MKKKEIETSVKEAKKKLAKITVEFKRATLSNGQMVASVTKENIIEKTYKQHRIQLTPEQIELMEPINNIGFLQVPIMIEGTTTIKTQSVNFIYYFLGISLPLNVNVKAR